MKIFAVAAIFTISIAAALLLAHSSNDASSNEEIEKHHPIPSPSSPGTSGSHQNSAEEQSNIKQHTPITPPTSAAPPQPMSRRANTAMYKDIYSGNINWADLQSDFYTADQKTRLNYARLASSGGNTDVVKGILSSSLLTGEQKLLAANSALRAGHAALAELFIAYGTPINSTGGSSMLDALLLNKRELSTADISVAAMLVAKGGYLSDTQMSAWKNAARTADGFNRKMSQIEAQGLYIPSRKEEDQPIRPNK